MSGYFARLASLIRAPGSATTSVKASIAPASLEQSIESEAAPSNSTVAGPADAAVRFVRQDSTRSMLQASAVQPDMPSTRSAQSARSAQAMPATVEPAAAERNGVSSAAPALRASTAPASPRDSTPSSRQAWAPMADAQSPPELRAQHFTPHLAPASNLPASADSRASDHLVTSPTPMPGQPASPVATNRAQPSQGFAVQASGNAGPGAPRSQAGLVETPTTSTAAPATQRTEIRIGTIALEVHTAAPATVTTAPQPAVVPRPTPAAQFSPRRHYLRWS